MLPTVDMRLGHMLATNKTLSASAFLPILNNIMDRMKGLPHRGEVATYIPALARIDPSKFGMSITTLDGTTASVGDANEPFSIQSISKLITTTMAMELMGEPISKRCGVEPSGSPFNSLVQLETEQGKPRNPFINAGALVMTDIVLSSIQNLNKPPESQGVWPGLSSASAKTVDGILLNARRLAGKWHTIGIDNEVAASERSCGYRNIALANFIKSFGNLENDPSEVLDTYFHQCALSASCRDLSRTFLFLANDGVDPFTSRKVTSKLTARRILALMLSCGHYDASGQFAFRVGLPGKSGVGGGIVCIVPGKMSIAIWSPGLNLCGNSLVGTAALEDFSRMTGFSVFQPYAI